MNRPWCSLFAFCLLFTFKWYILTCIVNRTCTEGVPEGLKLDFSGCANIEDDSFSDYAERFVEWRSNGRPVHHVEQLCLSDCWRISHAVLLQLANIGSLNQLQACSPDQHLLSTPDASQGVEPHTQHHLS